MLVRYVVCSERQNKPVNRQVCDSHAEAEAALERLRDYEAQDPEDSYWLAEVGPESEAWRWLAPMKKE